MLNHTQMTRRHMLGTAVVGATGLMAAGAMTQGCKNAAPLCPGPVVGDPRIREPFPILSTPFMESGKTQEEIDEIESRFAALKPYLMGGIC